MLRSLHDLKDYAIGATDGPIGQVKDFYFDDDRWTIRYLVVETGSWLASRQVLITPFSIRGADWAKRLLPVSITREQVRNSPDIDTERPVSRQHELRYLGYYGYPVYWGGLGVWGDGMYPYAMLPGFPGFGPDATTLARDEADYLAAERERHRKDDPHLRSCHAVAGYRLHAIDGEIGHVDGLLVDDFTWAVRYLVVDTRNWWLGHQVLIAPQWVAGINWADRSVSIDVHREAVRQAPRYDATLELDRQREMSLYRHYGRPGYWGPATPLAPAA